MNKSIGQQGDQPYDDPVAYGNGPDDAIDPVGETQAVTHHVLALAGRRLVYTANAGHLVTADQVSSQPNAAFFYVAFTLDGQAQAARPVTFFYNGGPGSSSVFLLLGSFAPRRIHTAMPDFTPPAPYRLEDNPDTLFDKSDLVFINPVGTGYSAAIKPYRNRDFWGVDQDADSLKQFIKRYLTRYQRWNSPKYLFGESYGTARSCVLAYRLHEDGVELNGITLQSSILDYRRSGDPVGALPTAAADAWYHKRLARPLADLGVYAEKAALFARSDYRKALARFPTVDARTLSRLSDYTGIDGDTLRAWKLDVASYDAQGHSLFLTTLLRSSGRALGAYDGRVTGIESGIAGRVDPNSGGNDPAMTAVSGVYTAMWNVYLNEALQYTSASSFTDLNDQAFANWDFHHVDPTGAQQGIDAQGRIVLYTAGDLAAVMALNVDLKVLSANGYYDFVTPFYQTVIDLQRMPLEDPKVRGNLSARFYPSGHMIYLDGESRAMLRRDLGAMYDATLGNAPAAARIRALQSRMRGRYRFAAGRG